MRPIPPNPCTPTPCGPNSQCQVVSGQAQCGCVPGMIGSAPNCRPECILSSECPSNRACINQKCVDPCVGTCAPNGECRVVSHSPVCSCAEGYSGDGFSSCRPIPVVGKIEFAGYSSEDFRFFFSNSGLFGLLVSDQLIYFFLFANSNLEKSLSLYFDLVFLIAVIFHSYCSS